LKDNINLDIALYCPKVERRKEKNPMRQEQQQLQAYEAAQPKNQGK
jgi:hypothetical protein